MLLLLAFSAEQCRRNVCRDDAVQRVEGAEAAQRSAEGRLEELRAERAAAETASKAAQAKKEKVLTTKHAEAVAALKAEMSSVAEELEKARTQLTAALGALGRGLSNVCCCNTQHTRCRFATLFCHVSHADKGVLSAVVLLAEVFISEHRDHLLLSSRCHRTLADSGSHSHMLIRSS